MPKTLRAAALVAFVVCSAVWVVYRTVERAQDSNQAVVHTQEVLTAIETVLSTLVNAESAARRDVASAGDRGPEPLDRAERSIDTDVNRLAMLTVDDPTRQANVQRLRQDATRPLAAVRAQCGTRSARLEPPVQRMPRQHAPVWMPRGRRCGRCAPKRTGCWPSEYRRIGLPAAAFSR